MFKDKDKIVGTGHRSALVLGAKATGKTSFVVSGSQCAPATLKAGLTPVDCDDVVLIQVEAESALGAMDLGMRPRVIDLSGVAGWQKLNQEIAKAINFLRPLVDAGEVSIVGIDLGAIDKEIRAWAAGDKVIPKDKLGQDDTALNAKDVNWGSVEAQGTALYRALRNLNCLVVGMAHLKATNYNPFSAKETADQTAMGKLVREQQGFGGDKSKLTADLAGGVYKPWVANASHLFTRDRDDKGNYVTHTSSNPMFEAGSRRSSKLSPIETRTFKAMLEDIYKF
jgi:hypothetical protein